MLLELVLQAQAALQARLDAALVSQAEAHDLATRAQDAVAELRQQVHGLQAALRRQAVEV